MHLSRTMDRRCLLLGILLLASHVRPEEKHDEHQPHQGHRGPPGGHWKYGEQREWSSEYTNCGGEAQSPINIQLSGTTFDPVLLPIILNGYNLTEEESLLLRNNGHTVLLQLPEDLLVVDGLPGMYRASQLHFHWGSPERPGSEHTVDGEHYPGEAHMVFFSSEYSSIKEAMDKPGGLAVLGAFIEAGPEENPYYAHLLQHLEQVANEGQNTQVPGFNIAGLLPTRMDRYYRYSGSLTTPPCFQSVNWTVFNDTIKISQEQLALLEDTVHGDNHEILQLNFRDAQSLNSRPVLASFRPPVGGRRGPIPGDGDSSGSRNAGADDGGTAKHLTESSLGTGDMLAIIFGVLFAFTAIAFFIYARKQKNKKRRMNSEDKPNVIYKAATTEDNIA